MLTSLRCSHKELLSQSRPKWLFSVVSHLLLKHTLSNADKELHLLLSPSQQSPDSCVLFYLTHNLPRSTQAALWGAISEWHARPRACRMLHRLWCHARTDTKTHLTHTLPFSDGPSPMHLIACDSSHCESQRSPISAVIITLVVTILPSPLSKFSRSYIAPFLPLFILVPLVPLSFPPCLL